MKIKALGVNGAFTKNYHNNFVFEMGERTLLVDAGTTLRYSLSDAGFKETDITDIIITHLHSDHVGGLEEFAQRCKWIFNHKPNLWVRGKMKAQLEEVIEKGLCTDGLTLNDYFNIYTCETGARNSFNIGNHQIELIDTDNLHSEGMLSMGLKITLENGHNVIYTSDIAKHQLAGFKDAIDERTSVLFHDVSMVENPVHSYIEDVVEHYKDVIAPHRIFAMHYQDETDLVELQQTYGISVVTTDHGYIV
ncbi:MBL fold metallo-hydrolase [Rossellomorea marisflavi]|uniref:MBL fold metallo-hydrolase n=1 Tax=Rossellomorea marisflavi TaxID=189381 RepID=A0A5D4RY88_9BACI|nr:MBL fold metallo-hydrolase [Rossellomorea marisflavi]TYS56355.1 MBL fold metallo-hydrolase [Rossellomorea marisflavi]